MALDIHAAIVDWLVRAGPIAIGNWQQAMTHGLLRIVMLFERDRATLTHLLIGHWMLSEPGVVIVKLAY